jgi:hypothetical protein
MSQLVISVYPSQLAQFKEKADALAVAIQNELHIKVGKFQRYDLLSRGIGHAKGHDRLIDNAKQISQADKGEPLILFSKPSVRNQIISVFSELIPNDINESIRAICLKLGLDEASNAKPKTKMPNLESWANALYENNANNVSTMVIDLNGGDTVLDACVDHDFDFRVWESIDNAWQNIHEASSNIELFRVDSPFDKERLIKEINLFIDHASPTEVFLIGDPYTLDISKLIGTLALRANNVFRFRYFSTSHSVHSKKEQKPSSKVTHSPQHEFIVNGVSDSKKKQFASRNILSSGVTGSSVTPQSLSHAINSYDHNRTFYYITTMSDSGLEFELKEYANEFNLPFNCYYAFDREEVTLTQGGINSVYMCAFIDPQEKVDKLIDILHAVAKQSLLEDNAPMVVLDIKSINIILNSPKLLKLVSQLASSKSCLWIIETDLSKTPSSYDFLDKHGFDHAIFRQLWIDDAYVTEKVLTVEQVDALRNQSRWEAYYRNTNTTQGWSLTPLTLSPPAF